MNHWSTVIGTVKLDPAWSLEKGEEGREAELEGDTNMSDASIECFQPCLLLGQKKKLWYIYTGQCSECKAKPCTVKFSSFTQACPTLHNPINCSMPGFPVHHQLVKLAQTHVHWVGDAIQPFQPLHSLILLPSIPPSIRVFSSESTLHMRWPKYWSFSFSISPSNEHPGLISFRMDWLDFLAVQGTFKSLLQHHSSKASVLWRSAF